MKRNKQTFNPALVLVTGMIIYNLLLDNTLPQFIDNAGLNYFKGVTAEPQLLTHGVWVTGLTIFLALVGLRQEEKFPSCDPEKD